MTLRSRLWKLITAICLTALLTTTFADDQTTSLESHFPFLAGLLDQANMVAPAKTPDPKTTTYILAATPATSQWGFFDNSQTPVLKIKSGDTVAIETSAAYDNQVVPGTRIDQIIRMSHAVKNRGPHTVTGPIYIEGAEPGDVLRIHINKIEPRAYASNNNAPGKGLFPELFPNGFVKYYYLDIKKMTMQFAPGVVIPLAPFPGVIAVAQAEPGKFSSDPPGKFGGNMDLREMTAGSTLYLPVFVKGGLVWTGDSHAGQGNGEIDLTAIETAFAELNVTIDVLKQPSLTWPRVETANAWIAVGYDQDLNKAFDILKGETVKLIMDKRHVSQSEAEQIMMSTWNCPIAEVVNGVQGVYCMVPKQTDTTATPLPQTDTDKLFVTYGKNADLEQAMKIASMAMIDKVVTTKHLSKQDAYILASFAMDCRIAPPQTSDKEVHCMLAKSLWVK